MLLGGFSVFWRGIYFMRNYLKYLLLLALIVAPVAYSQAQVSIGVQIGPSYGIYNAPPVCAYGFYPTYPFGCAPYGFYGSNWFVDGVFIGAGPWSNFYFSHPGFYRPFYFNRGFGFNEGFRSFRGEPFRGEGFRSFRNDGRFRGDGFRGDGFRSFRGEGFRGDDRGVRGDDRGFRGREGVRNQGSRNDGFRNDGYRSANSGPRGFRGSEGGGRSINGGGNYHGNGGNRGGGSMSRGGGNNRGSGSRGGESRGGESRGHR